MVRKTVTIPDNIYEQIKNEDNFSELVSTLLAEHIRQQNIENARAAFGIRSQDEPDGVSEVNVMRREGERLYSSRNSN